MHRASAIFHTATHSTRSLTRRSLTQANRSFSVLSQFATVDPAAINGQNPGRLQNCVGGKWVDAAKTSVVLDPMNGEPFIISPDTKENELQPFIDSMRSIPKTGTHNVYKNPEKFLLYGDVNRRVAEALHDPEVLDFFVKCVQRVMPKSKIQAEGEVVVVRKFFENFSGDNVRLMMRGFVQAGDHCGQRSIGYRWPYGPVAVVAPFNFPLEIPVMQFVAAAMVGNKPVVKPESRVGLPVDQFLRLMHHCGLPADAIDLIHCRGSVMSKLLTSVDFRMTQFTGGTDAAHKVSEAVQGRVKLEDAGFDWKVLGPLNSVMAKEELDRTVSRIAWQCDQDAYSLSGQKCSAQSIALMHEDWVKLGLIEKMAELSSRRSLSDLTLSPVLSHSNAEIEEHMNKVLAIPGSKLLFGGKPLEGHKVPEHFGSFQPTAIEVDMMTVLENDDHFRIVTSELFGPFQIVAKWADGQKENVVKFLEKMDAHLTAAIVSPDPDFVNYMIANTVNGTTYAGMRARTTGAPQNHWFGPAGTPLAAGIGTPEAIRSTWTCHREIVMDENRVPAGWTTPPPS